MPAIKVGGSEDEAADGGGGDARNALLLAIQKGKTLKKVDDPDSVRSQRRATIANPKSGGGGGGGDLMSALKERMNLRRKGISGARKDDADREAGGATGDAPPASLDKGWKSMPNLPSQGDAPISMAGMTSALKAAASNRKDDDDDDGDWSD